MPESSPTVSVALCTHNGMPYVAEQVRSILHQSVPPNEIVLSDDASTDATVATVQDIVARFRAERPESSVHLTVLRNETALGVVRNFEQAVKACTRELIALCDQDDVWHPERLETVVEEFASRPDLTLLHGDARLVDDWGESLRQNLFEAIGFTDSEARAVQAGRAFGVLLRRNVVTGATTVFRRELLERALPFPAAWVHDEWLAMIASIVGRVDFVPQPLVDYRQHGANQIGARKPTLGDKIGRLQEPRAQRNRRLKSRAQALVDHVAADPDVSDRVKKLAAAKLQHELARSALPASRLRRVLPVLAGALAGRYSRFGRARYDVARDILQPDEAAASAAH